MEFNKVDFYKLKKKVNYCTCDLPLSNCHASENCTTKRRVIENNASENRTPKLDMVCDRTRFKGQACHYRNIKRSHSF